MKSLFCRLVRCSPVIFPWALYFFFCVCLASFANRRLLSIHLCRLSVGGFFLYHCLLIVLPSHTHKFSYTAIGFDFFSFIHFPVCPGNMFQSRHTSVSLSLSLSCCGNLLIYIFSIIGSIYFSQLPASNSAFVLLILLLFVYASFWFSQLKLYLLFLFSLVISTVSVWVRWKQWQLLSKQLDFRLHCDQPQSSLFEQLTRTLA